ncbi:MAG: DUF1232 domain-containing protein [Myxococcota bacterium]
MDVRSIERAAKRAALPTDESAAPAAVEQALAREADFEAKARKAPGRIRRQLEQMKLFMRMLKEIRRGEYRRLPWLTLASFAGAILYFLNPVDIVPDFILGIGFLDDATVAALVVQAFRRDLTAYCKTRELDTNFYFGE